MICRALSSVAKWMRKGKSEVIEGADHPNEEVDRMPAVITSSYPTPGYHGDPSARFNYFEAPPPYSEIPGDRYINTPPYTTTDISNLELPRYTPTSQFHARRNSDTSDTSAVIMFNSDETTLPPILTRRNLGTRIINNPNVDALVKQIEDDAEPPVVFIVNKNLLVRVKIVNNGMGASNQEEVVITVKCYSFEISDTELLRTILRQFNFIFEKGKSGHTLNDYDVIELQTDMRCVPNLTGVLFYRPTLQCLQKIQLPSSTYFFGMYIDQSELAWAKVIPLRLLLRLGAEFKYYPCPLFNVINRSPVYRDFDGTILKSYADFNAFTYTIPRIPGVTINLRGDDVVIKLPKHRSYEVVRAINKKDDSIVLAGNFSLASDGQLVSVKKHNGYKTQTLSIKLKENRKITCASFLVMTGSLKSVKDGAVAQSSIVEDGVVVEMTEDILKQYKVLIKEKKNCVVEARGQQNQTTKVSIEWTSVDTTERKAKKKSPIDLIPFDNCTNMKIRHGYDYTVNNQTEKIKLVEVHFLPTESQKSISKETAEELGQMMTGLIAEACMGALTIHLVQLLTLQMNKIGLRINLNSDVGYKIGSNCQSLPCDILSSLDEKLIPAIHNVTSQTEKEVVVELIFYVAKIV